MEGVEHGDGCGRARIVVRMLWVKGLTWSTTVCALGLGVSCSLRFSLLPRQICPQFQRSALVGVKDACELARALLAAVFGGRGAASSERDNEQPLYR